MRLPARRCRPCRQSSPGALFAAAVVEEDRPDAGPGAQNRERRIEIALGQTPFCVLVSCSDSRVSPEILFGRGLGELFIVRNAGNTVDTTAMGSIEYAACR